MFRSLPDRPIQLIVRGSVSKDSSNIFTPVVIDGAIFNPNFYWALRVKCLGIDNINVVDRHSELHSFNIMISLVRDWPTQQLKSIGQFSFNNLNPEHFTLNASFLYGIHARRLEEAFYVYIVPATNANFNTFSFHCIFEIFAVHF